MWWVVLTLIGVVAMVVGPVAMLRLNPAERRQEALRQAARERGLQVRLQPQKLEGEATVALPTYLLPAPGEDFWRLTRARYQHDLHLQGWWQWAEGQRPPQSVQSWLETILARLPASVEVVGSGVTGVYVCWRERGGLEALEQIHICLRYISEKTNKNKGIRK